MLCEENGLPFAREARDEGRFGVWVVARATGRDYGEVLTDVKAEVEVRPPVTHPGQWSGRKES